MNCVKHSFLSIDDVADIISSFVFDESGILPMSECTYNMFPILKGNIKFGEENLVDKIKVLIKEQYDLFVLENKDLVGEYDLLISKYSGKYFDLLNEYFKIDKDYSVNAGVGLLPIFPRNIKEESYCITKMSDEDVVSVFMHEACHFAFFEKCRVLFENLIDEDLNNPSLLWYLSEIVIDPILNRDEFQLCFKYNFRAYDNFYSVVINGQNLVEVIKDIFDNNSIDDSIKITYDYLLDNEKEFRLLCGDEESVQNKRFILNDVDKLY
ncbi:MAG: hypothetical protein R3Y21_02425 [Mycoplasmatota bacterium]